MEQLVITCHNLMETNNGMFKSEKQKAFLLSQSAFGVICHSGVTYQVSWVDRFDLDDDGIVSYSRKSNKKGLQVLWERGQVTAKQKSKAKQLTKIAKAEAEANRAETAFNAASLAKYGYIVDSNRVDQLWSAIQAGELTRILQACNYKIDTATLVAYNELLPAFEQIKAIHAELSNYLQQHRIKIIEGYFAK